MLTAAIVLPAQARADCGVTAPEVGWQLAVHLSHSYCLTVTPADVSPNGGGEVLVVQSTKGTPATGLTRVEYPTRSAGWSDQWKSVALARADNWVSVDLGARGNLAVHFYPRRTAPLPPRGGCAGQVGRQLLGVWKGTITFTGEHRYATVHTRSTPGTVVLNPGRASDPNCGQVVTVGPTDIPGPFSLTTLTIEAAHAGSTDLFDAYMAQGVSTVEFKADAARRSHESGCSVERLAPASDLTPSSDLDWNAQTAPSSATLAPPAPFTGAGRYANGTLTGTISFYCPKRAALRSRAESNAGKLVLLLRKPGACGFDPTGALSSGPRPPAPAAIAEEIAPRSLSQTSKSRRLEGAALQAPTAPARLTVILRSSQHEHLPIRVVHLQRG